MRAREPAPEDKGPVRRCIATGARMDRALMIRFVVGPEGFLVFDLAARLPGRGVWVEASRLALERAVKRNLFARGLKTGVKTPETLLADLESQLARRVVEALGMARKAGLAVCGYEKTREALRSGPNAVRALCAARDGAPGAKAKMRAMGGKATLIECLDACELGLAFSREVVIHAALKDGGATDRVIHESRRLEGLRGP